MKYNYKYLGQQIKENREEKGMSRRNLAARVDISDTELKRIEDGERIAPNLITLIKLCRELEMNLQFLLEDSDFIETPTLKIFWVIVKYNELNLFKIEATSDVEAVKIILNFISSNDIVDIDGSHQNIEFFASDDRENINKVLGESDLELVDFTNDDGTFGCPYCGATIFEDDLD